MDSDLVRVVESNPSHDLGVSIRNLEKLAEIREAALRRLFKEGVPPRFKMTERERKHLDTVEAVIKDLPQTLQYVASRGFDTTQLIQIFPEDFIQGTPWKVRRDNPCGREALLSPSHWMLWDYLEAELLQPFFEAKKCLTIRGSEYWVLMLCARLPSDF